MINNLASLKQFFKDNIKTPIFGVGVSAFDRLGMEKIVDNYRLLTLRHNLDTKIIEKDIEILCLEKGMGTKHIDEPRNGTTILKLPKTKKYLSQFDKPAILVYKASTKMEEVCQKNGWLLMANPTVFGKKLFENKINFRRLLEKIGVAAPPGRVAKLEGLKYGHLLNVYGLPFVIQHPSKGSGKGTYFIRNQEQFDEAVKRLKSKIQINEWEEEEKVIPPDEVIVTRFIEGPSPSLTGCITRHGVLSTSLQYQVLSIPELVNPECPIMFCGHDWTGARFSEKINQQAYEIVEKVGMTMKEQGYRGIFGLDFIMDKEKERLYVVECNPRLLGSFPTNLMAQDLDNEPSILAFHVLEFLNADYEMDREEINRQMRREKNGAHMFLHNLSGRWAKNHQELKAGVYKIEKEKMKYLRPGYDLKHLKDKEEFLLTDGVSFLKSHFSPNRRLCRILTLNNVLDEETHKQLTPWAKKIAETVYRGFNIKPVRFVRLKKFFFPNLLAKG